MEFRKYISVPDCCEEVPQDCDDDHALRKHCINPNNPSVDPNHPPQTTSQQVLEQIRREINLRLEVLP